MNLGISSKYNWPRQVLCYLLALAALAFATMPGPGPYLSKRAHHHPSRRSLIEFGAVSVHKQLEVTSQAAKQNIAQSQAPAAGTEPKMLPRFRLLNWASSSYLRLQPVQLRVHSLLASRGPP